MISDTLAELGASLYLVDRSESDIGSLPNQLEDKHGINAYGITCDLESEEERKSLVQQVEDRGHGLNILINNAAFIGSSSLKGWSVPFEEQSLESWRQGLEVNLTAAFDLCQGLSPLLKASGSGNIINIASIYGQYGPDWSLYEGTSMSNPAAYGASKGGLIQLSRWLATTLAPDVRVNVISPGGISRGQPQSFVERYESRTPMGRMATEEDFRGSIAFFASKASGYVTGHNLMVDGGWGIW